MHVSSKNIETKERVKQTIKGRNFVVIGGNVTIEVPKLTINHFSVVADLIGIKAKRLLNRASQLQAKEIIYIESDEQTHETVINKWVQDVHHGSNYVHAEGVKSIDDAVFSALIVVQKGRRITNKGICVEADYFEDRGILTSNMPAHVILYNISHMEKDSLFSHAASDIRRTDDVLVPSRYHVNYYKSLAASDGTRTEVKFGYTLIQAGADIIITKDIKEDIPITENHTLEIHEEKSGFCIFGGASVPDPTTQLKAIHAAYKSNNMLGLTTSTISAVAKGIQAYNNAEL